MSSATRPEAEAQPAGLPGLAGPAALVVAHPGHELRVHGWLERLRPSVFMLTDGSGGAGRSRLAGSAAVIQRAGARAGSLFGRHSDRELYAALLAGRLEPFLALARELHAALRAQGCADVVADWRDGYNPLHDVCRDLVDAVVARLRSEQLGQGSFAITLVDGPGPAAEPPGPPAATLRLEDEALERKLAAARGYPGLEREVEAALQRDRHAAPRLERFYAVPAAGLPEQRRPWYERYGEQQVAAGRYSEVLRFETHVRPLARRLADGDF